VYAAFAEALSQWVMNAKQDEVLKKGEAKWEFALK
jgi:hypothetical protein